MVDTVSDQELADAVRKAATELNQAVKDAASRGLRTEMQINTITSMSERPRDIVVVEVVKRV